MIVVDASVVAELAIRGPGWRLAADRVIVEGLDLHVPHVLDLEVASVLRRAVRAGSIGAADAGVALSIAGSLRLVRHAHEPFLARVWDLRENLTPYDAAYVALAEALDVPLVTFDARLAGASGNVAEVELLRR